MFATFLRLNSQSQPGWRGLNIALSCIGIIALTIIKIGVNLPNEYPQWAYLSAVAFLGGLALLQFVWRKQSQFKNHVYLWLYHVVLIFTTLTINTYHPLFVSGWVVLMVASGLLLHLRGALISFASFILSIIAIDFLHHIETGVFLGLLVQSALIGGTAIIVAQVIEMSQQRGAELERSREKERLERERLLALVNSMGDAVIATNEKGEIRIYNGAASNLLDTNADLTGKSITRVLHLRQADGKKVPLMKMLNELQGNIVRTDLLHQFADKERMNLYLNIALIHLGYQNEGERGYTFLLRDITKEKSLEQERDEFISVVSHELRTPIAIAEGSLSNALILQKRGISQQMINQSITEAHDQVLFLSKMANDLATLSRAERGTETLEIEPVDLSSFLEELRATYEPQAKEKKLTLAIKAKAPLKPLPTSRLYLQEILQNFITNAIKYTKEGTVTISVESEPHGAAIFRVKDSGIGISKSDQKHLFEKFFRSEDYRTRENSGTGLGLYLVKKLADKLGARISLQSRLNYGSTFIITVPPIDQKPTIDDDAAPTVAAVADR